MGFLDTAGRFIAHNPGAVAGIGAGLGAAGNVAREAVRSDDQPKNYLGAGLRGAAVGGLAGAGVGGLGRAARDVQLLHPEISGAKNLAMGTAKHLGEGVSNFAQRQVHGLTGYGSGDAAHLDRIGIMGKNVASEKAQLLNQRASDIVQHNPSRADRVGASLLKDVKAVHAEGEVGQRFRDLGMTSVPGAIKSMVTNPRESSKAIWNQLSSGHPVAGAAAVGIPTALAGADLARGDESAQGGRTMGEKTLRAGANIGGGLLFGGAPLVTQAVAGGLTEHAAGRLGRAAASLRHPVASTAS